MKRKPPIITGDHLQREIMQLNPYHEYKPAMLPWLPDVPKHWELIPNWALMHLKKEVVGELAATQTLLSLTKVGIIERDMENPTGKFPTSFDTYQSVQPGDLIFCLFDMDETPRTVGLSTLHGMVTGAYTRFTCSDETLRRFLFLLYLHLDNGKLLKPIYSGLRKVISTNTFLTTKSPVPPKSEQASIVRFLDHTDEQIQRYIASKERLIALLEEERQALVHQAVTRGLDPNVRLKPSGVEWLGDVPEHWEVRRLRHLGEAIIGLTYEPQDVRDTGTLVLRASNISGREITLEDKVMVEKDIPNRLITRQGDILVCSRSGSRALIGKNARIDSVSEGMTFGAFMTIFRGPNNDYLHQVFNSKIFEYQSGAFSTSTINQLTLGMINSIHVPFPPSEEQGEISREIESSTANIQAGIHQTRRQIDLMNEYRTRLIADVVTGQLDVREPDTQLSEPP